MALSPADFAAYSRATGAPYPESPQERAELAPEVLAFRRGQLAQPEQQSNLPAILGGTVLGLGALGAALAGTRRFARGTKTQSTPQRDLGIVRQAATGRTSGTTAPRTPAPPTPGTPPSSEGVAPSRVAAIPQATVNLDEYLANAEKQRRAEVYKKVAAKPAEDLQKVFIPKGGSTEDVLITDPNTGEIFRRGQSTGNIQNLSSQTMAALESGEDQRTGRVLRGVQRNEDLDASQVNQVARQTGNANVAASMTPDGVPVDQTNFWGDATVPNLVQEGKQYGPQPLRLLPAATQGRQQQAQSFLSQKRQELSGQFSPTRTERILSENPELLEAAELYASTGDPNVLSRFSAAPSTPVTVKPTVQMGINTEEFPTGQFYKKTNYPENTGDLLERDIELTNEISSIGLQQQQLAAKAEELGEQELMLRVAMDRDPKGGGAYTKMFGQVKYEQQNLPKPEALNVDLGDALEERDFLRRYMGSLESLGSTYKLGDFQEGVRPFYEYDAQGNIIPQTLELRAGRRSVDLDPKTGGGRLVAEYDPKGQTGSTSGVYGIEQTSRRSSESTRPTQMTINELVREGLEQATASPEGDVPIPPSLEQMTERRPTAVARRSIDASQIVRQAIIEGRDPQMVLRQRGFNV
jgi:hypothetical protein